jgi:ABC-2 type transport system ATP-binding protein
MMNSPDAAIVIDGLRVRRGKNLVLDGLSLTIPRGQVIGLLGPSGCGKTTLMRSIVGVQKIAGGTVTVLGDVAGSPSLRHRIGYVTQSASTTTSPCGRTSPTSAACSALRKTTSTG